MDIIISAFLFLIKVVFSLYIFVILLRILLQLANIDIFNPIHQFVLRLTHKPTSLIQKVIPRIKGFDTPALTLLILLEVIKILLIALLVGKSFHIVGIIFWVVGDLLSQISTLYFYLILAAALLSWFAHFYQTPVTYVLHKLTEPLFALSRRYIPPLGGFDISPIVILLALQLLSIVIISPLTNIGMRLTFG